MLCGRGVELDVEGGVLVGSETGVEDYWEQSCGVIFKLELRTLGRLLEVAR